jgi:Icc protein
MTSRRRFLQTSLLAGVPLLTTAEALAGPLNPKKKRVLRAAHLTDCHILPKPEAEAALRRVFREVNGLKDRPDLILNTGDTIMDSNGQTRQTVAERWGTWQRITREENKLPLRSALGNHDEWFAPKGRADEFSSDPRYGKAWALEVLGMPGRYYAFEANGWHFVVLDSINRQTGYHLDTEQMAWLRDRLAAIPAARPVCVLSHVPILSMGSLMYYVERKPAPEVAFPTYDMHIDAKDLKNLFFKHKNVRLALSGHVHYVDSVAYLGVTYRCNGAVSGNWWDGALDEFPPVYAILDFYADGSHDCALVAYK